MIFNEQTPQEWLEEQNELDRMNLVCVDDLLPLWMALYAHRELCDRFEKEFHELTTDALRYCWDDEAFVEVKLDEGMIYYKHADGREISRLIAF